MTITWPAQANAEEASAKSNASQEVTTDWSPGRPKKSLASTKVARSNSDSVGWTSARKDLANTSQHLQWIAPHESKQKHEQSTKNVSSEMPTRVRSTRKGMTVLRPSKQREFGPTLGPPPAPQLSVVPNLPTKAKVGSQGVDSRSQKALAGNRISQPKADPAVSDLQPAQYVELQSVTKPQSILHPFTQTKAQSGSTLSAQNTPVKGKETKQNMAAVANTAWSQPAPQNVVIVNAAQGATNSDSELQRRQQDDSASQELHRKELQLKERELSLTRRELAFAKQQLDLVLRRYEEDKVTHPTPRQVSQPSAPADSKPQPASEKKEIRQVQHLDDLRLPVQFEPKQVDEVAGTSVLADSTGNLFDAPSPSDRKTDPSARQTRVAQRFQFKDLTPLTKEVQSRFDDDLFDSTPTNNEDIFSLDDLSTADPPNESAPVEPAGATDEPVNGLTNPAPEFDTPPSSGLPGLDLPESTSSPDNGSPTFDLPGAATDVTSPETSATENSLDEKADDLKERLMKQLQEQPELPTLGGDDDRPLDLSDGEEDSLLFSGDTPGDDDGSFQGDLSATNGRDCAASAESCETDLQYLERRQRTSDISLNITPSLSPAEIDMAKIEQTRIEKMGKTQLRTWRDRSGNVIADGNLDDFRNDQVVIRTVNGTFRSVPHHKLSNADRCYVEGWWEIPPECNFENERYQMRDFRLTTFTWAAAGTCHKPLYFEQVGVERYGHSSGPIIQPIVSGAHFFGDILMMPYHVGINPPSECQYTLGHYRPGDCAPWLVPGFPVSERGFTWEGLAFGAAMALLP